MGRGRTSGSTAAFPEVESLGFSRRRSPLSGLLLDRVRDDDIVDGRVDRIVAHVFDDLEDAIKEF